MSEPVLAPIATAARTHLDADVAVIGGGAAGLMTAIWAARTCAAAGTPTRVVVVDGARMLGAKILVSGGGRCNVTHHIVAERDFNGSTPASIRRVLHQWSVDDTIAFFKGLGVALKRESTGKLFPVSDRSRDVLEALLGECGRLGVALHHPWRVVSLRAADEGFQLRRADGAELVAAVVVLATGGCSLPKSGSDGTGYTLARTLGHHVVPAVPALVPLVLDRATSPLPTLSGVSAQVRLEVRSESGRRLWAAEGELLCTHIGVSGPVVLDASRHLLIARQSDPGSQLVVSWLPKLERAQLNDELRRLGTTTPSAWLRRRLPERLARVLCEAAGVPATQTAADLPRELRARLVGVLTGMPLPVIGDRGFVHAEVTAGGVPLAEIQLRTMESRLRSGLYLVGEICDVDGRIGGFNFQWAWASGAVAGRAIGQRLATTGARVEAQ